MRCVASPLLFCHHTINQPVYINSNNTLPSSLRSSLLLTTKWIPSRLLVIPI
jgi:hypothetical protein